MWVALAIVIAFLVVLWRTQPAKADVTITAIRYTLDDVTWIGLDGATLEPGYFKVSVTWKNNSSEPINTLMTLVVEDQGQEPDQESVEVAPNEEVTAALIMKFIEGERKVTAQIYKEDDMARIASKTVNVFVKEEVAPPPPTASATIDIKAEVDTSWPDLEGLGFKFGDTVTLGVFWTNTTPTAGVTATTSLIGTRPDGGLANIILVGTDTRTVGVGGSVYVKYSLLFDMAGTWSFEALLDGDVV